MYIYDIYVDICSLPIIKQLYYVYFKDEACKAHRMYICSSFDQVCAEAKRLFLRIRLPYRKKMYLSGGSQLVLSFVQHVEKNGGR